MTTVHNHPITLPNVHKPRLNLVKRTKQLHDSETVILATDGTPEGTLHTTVGEKEMQPADNELLIANLASARTAGAVERITNACLQEAASFFESTIRSLMPPGMVLYTEDTITNWMRKEGIELHRDGLRAIVIRQGRVLAESEPDIPATWRALVEARLRQVTAQAGGGQ